ncbi:MAG: GNAT family N-acetyltransferase, partial [Paenibacillaceae bacterium]|nr:GNAT family N-acetyltransferase [Paenibacillaceae bacterium]
MNFRIILILLKMLRTSLQDPFIKMQPGLAQDFEGRGVISRACREVVRYVFEELELNRIEIRVQPENLKSRKIPENIGFVREGTLRQAEWFIDRFVDKVIYGLLKEEWI